MIAQPLTERDGGGVPISVVLLAFVLLVATIVLAVTWWAELAHYLMGADVASAAFAANSDLADLLSAIWMFAASTGGILGAALMLLRVMGSDNDTLVRQMKTALMVVLALGFLAFMLRMASYNSSAAHIGSPLRSVLGGSAYCWIGLYVVYRLALARRSAGSDPKAAGTVRLFTDLLIFVALVPAVFRAGYGLWYAVLGSAMEGMFLQQMLLAYVLPVAPVIVLYFRWARTSDAQDAAPARTAGPLAAGLTALMLIGTGAYVALGVPTELY